MELNDIFLVSNKLNVAQTGDVDELESRFGCPFPVGYREFVCTLGEGIFCNLVRVYLPSRILNENSDFQKRWAEYFPWGEGHPNLPKEKIVESIVIADTLNGDEFVFHPGVKDAVFRLPRHSDDVSMIAGGLSETLLTICDNEAYDLRYFDSVTNRVTRTFTGDADFFSVVKKLSELNLHDATEGQSRLHDDVDPFDLERHIDFFVRDFCGSILVSAEYEDEEDEDHELTVVVTHEEGTASPKLEATVSVLQELDLEEE